MKVVADSLDGLDLRILQNDLPDSLVRQDLLVDNFQETYFTKIQRSQPIQSNSR